MLGPWEQWGPSCPWPAPLGSIPLPMYPRCHFSPNRGHQSLPQWCHSSVSFWFHFHPFLIEHGSPSLKLTKKYEGSLWALLLSSGFAHRAQVLKDSACHEGYGRLCLPWHSVYQPKRTAGSHCCLMKCDDEFWWKWYVSFVCNLYCVSCAVCMILSSFFQWEF